MKRSSSPPIHNMQSRSGSPDIRHLKRKLNHSSTAISSNQNQNNTTTPSTMDMKNHDVCDSCGGVGQFLCCDACPNAFHFTCVEPPMDSTDVANLKDKWFCNECEHKQAKGKRNKSNPRGLFYKLIEDISTKNPKAYRLPNDIVNFFKGVSSDKLGIYLDTTVIKPVRYKNGQIEHPDYRQLKDKNGKFRCCYYCRQTALKKPMIGCDYCTLYWHLDCLNPPLASPPNPAKRWMCPNHIERIIKPPREQRNPETVTMNKENKMPSSAYHHHLSEIIEKELADNEHEDKKRKITKPNLVDSTKTTFSTENIITSKTGVVYRLPVNPIQLDFSGYVEKVMKDKNNDRRSSIPSTTASSSSSEVNTPPSFNSPITSHKPISHITSPTITNNDNEVDAWLHNMAWFQAGGQIPTNNDDNTTIPTDELPAINHKEDTAMNDDGLLTLIRAATQTSPPSSPIPSTSNSSSPSTTSTTNSKKRKFVDSDKYEKYLKIEQLLRQKDEKELINMFSSQ